MLLLALSCHKPALKHAPTYATSTCGWESVSEATTSDFITIDEVPRRMGSIALEVREDGLWLYGERLDEPVERLRDEREFAGELARHLDEPVPGLGLGVARSASVGQVESALLAAWEAGFTSVRVLGISTQPPDRPPPPRPAYAQSLREELDATSPEMHQTLLAEKLSKQVGRCRPAKNVFSALAHAAPEMKCVLMWHGMNDALKRCPGAAAGRAITLLYVMTVPEDFTTWVEVELDPEAEAWTVDPKATWDTVGPEFITRSSLWLDTES